MKNRGRAEGSGRRKRKSTDDGQKSSAEVGRRAENQQACGGNGGESSNDSRYAGSRTPNVSFGRNVSTVRPFSQGNWPERPIFASTPGTDAGCAHAAGRPAAIQHRMNPALTTAVPPMVSDLRTRIIDKVIN